jgi:uncharacterized membrane protein
LGLAIALVDSQIVLIFGPEKPTLIPNTKGYLTMTRNVAIIHSPKTSPPAFWSHYLTFTLGLWLLGSALSFGYDDSRMGFSELASGFLLLGLSSVSLIWQLSWPKWMMAITGLWLTVAPLVFWSPSAAAYANGNLVGSLVLITSVIVPSLLRKEDLNSDTPPGWTYNPSTWSQRIPILGLAFIGFLLAKYLAAYQLGHISTVWDPFFADGTKRILESDVSRAFPISDAGLGAWSYLLDAIAGIYGSTRRWRTQPWVVVLFGLMVIPPGVTSIVLVMLQPIVVGAWCTICLTTAIVMLLMIPPAIDEVVATVQFLKQSKLQGKSLWKTFWYGGEGIGSIETTPIQIQRSGSFAWNLFLSSILGLWLMLSPTVFGTQDLASDSHHLLGALIVTFAVIAMAQVARPVRFINCLLGLSLALLVWFLPGGTASFIWNATGVGIALTLLSIPRGRISDRFGKYDKVIRWSPFGKKHSFDHNEESKAA